MPIRDTNPGCTLAFHSVENSLPTDKVIEMEGMRIVYRISYVLGYVAEGCMFCFTFVTIARLHNVELICLQIS